MRFLSLFSGIEAASVAWAPLGWKAAAFAEIDKNASAVLAHHYPDVPNLGDVSKFQEWPDLGPIDLVCGGSPCQSYSVAGLRGGLDDPRGDLMLTFAAVVRKYRPRWVVWENVPGVLSSGEGRDFGSLLGLLSGRRVEVPAGGWQSAGVVPGYERAYGLAWRVLDAQYTRIHGFERAVPQRRRRVFVVGCAGSWQRAAAVLLERESLRGNPPPRRSPGKGSTYDAAPCLTSSGRGVERTGETRGQDPLVAVSVSPTLRAGGNRTGGDRPPGTDVDTCETLVAHALRAEGFDASEDGTGRGTPIIPILEVGKGSSSRGDGPNGSGIGKPGDPMFTLQAGAQHAIAFDTTQITSATNRCQPKAGDPCHPLAAGAHPPAIAFSCKDYGNDAMEGATPTLRAMGHADSHANAGGQLAVAISSGQGWWDEGDIGATIRAQDSVTKADTLVSTSWAVRRLTPEECEALQGFPRGYTAIPTKRGIMADGPRYKMLGNSWATNCARWIGQRIDMVEAITSVPALEAAE